MFVEEGLTEQEIADRLVIEITTARTHFHFMFQKLGYFGRNRRVDLLIDYYRKGNIGR